MEQIKKGKFAIVFKNGTFNPEKTNRDEIPDLICKAKILEVFQNETFLVSFIFSRYELHQRIVHLQEMQNWSFFETAEDCDSLWNELVEIKYNY